jgi:hypothetical protein
MANFSTETSIVTFSFFLVLKKVINIKELLTANNNKYFHDLLAKLEFTLSGSSQTEASQYSNEIKYRANTIKGTRKFEMKKSGFQDSLNHFVIPKNIYYPFMIWTFAISLVRF